MIPIYNLKEINENNLKVKKQIEKVHCQPKRIITILEIKNPSRSSIEPKKNITTLILFICFFICFAL